MKPLSRILIGTIVFLLVVAAGFAAGYFASGLRKYTSSANDLKPYKPQTANNRVYDASPPSIGADLETFSLPDLKFAAGTYSRQITLEEAQILTKGQKVLLYGDDGRLLNALGEVIAVGENFGDTDQRKTLVVSFAQPGLVDEGQVFSGKIALSRSTGLARLPPEAVLQNKDGQAFVWEVQRQDDETFKTYLKPVTVIASREGYVGIQAPYDYSNLYILKPDNRLEDGQVVNIRIASFTGPETTDEMRVQALLDDYMAARNMAMEKNRETARKQAAASGGCGVMPNYAQQFMDQIKAKSPPPEPKPEPQISRPSAL